MKKFLLALTLALIIPVSAQAAQTVNMVLTWVNGQVAADGSNAPTGVKIERKTGLAGTYAQIQQVGVVTTYTDVIANDPGSVTYCYRLRETNGAGDSAYSNEACATTPVIKVPPPTPGSLTIQLSVQ